MHRSILALLVRPPDVSQEGLKFYPWTPFFFFLYQSTVLRAQQPHRGWPSNVFQGSVVGKVSIIGIGISPPLIFTGGQKVWNYGSFKTSLDIEPPAFESTARYPNSETKVLCCNDRPMSWPSLVKLGSCTPEKALSDLTHPLKLHVKMR